jgi:hypothetical protein
VSRRSILPSLLETVELSELRKYQQLKLRRRIRQFDAEAFECSQWHLVRQRAQMQRIAGLHLCSFFHAFLHPSEMNDDALVLHLVFLLLPN